MALVRPKSATISCSVGVADAPAGAEPVTVAVGVDGATPGAGSAACSECGTHASASASSNLRTKAPSEVGMTKRSGD